MRHIMFKGNDPRDNRPGFWILREYEKVSEVAYISGKNWLSEKHAVMYIKSRAHTFIYQDLKSLPFNIHDFEVMCQW